MRNTKESGSPGIRARRTRVSALLLMAGFVLGLIASSPLSR